MVLPWTYYKRSQEHDWLARPSNLLLIHLLRYYFNKGGQASLSQKIITVRQKEWIQLVSPVADRIRGNIAH